MNKYGVSVELKVLPIDKQERAIRKVAAKLYEQYLEWRTEEAINEFIGKAKQP